MATYSAAMNRAAKISMVMVPHKSTTDALADLLGNRIQVWVTPVASGLPVNNNRQARMIATTGESRLKVLPDVPTFKEAGYADLTYFLLTAKGTPQPVVDRLHAAIDKAMRNPKVMEALAPQGIDETRGSPAELGACLAAEVKRWADIVKQSAPTSVGK